LDMASRVSTSANRVLGLDHLNAYHGPDQYEMIAIGLGKNSSRFQQTRDHLIGTALQRNPMHPYWDVPRYVKNFEKGLIMAWERFLEGLEPDHIKVSESPEASKGTFDEEIEKHPAEGPRVGEL